MALMHKAWCDASQPRWGDKQGEQSWAECGADTRSFNNIRERTKCCNSARESNIGGGGAWDSEHKRPGDILSSVNNNPGPWPTNFPGRWCRAPVFRDQLGPVLSIRTPSVPSVIKWFGWNLITSSFLSCCLHWKYFQDDDNNQIADTFSQSDCCNQNKL